MSEWVGGGDGKEIKLNYISSMACAHNFPQIFLLFVAAEKRQTICHFSVTQTRDILSEQLWNQMHEIG